MDIYICSKEHSRIFSVQFPYLKILISIPDTAPPRAFFAADPLSIISPVTVLAAAPTTPP